VAVRNPALDNSCGFTLEEFTMIVDEGLITLLKFILRDAEIDAKIGLYVSNTTPSASTVMADLTEATFDSYARKTAVSITWPDPAINLDGNAESDGPTLTWTTLAENSPAQTVYGLFVVIDDNAANEKLLFAHRFATEIVVEHIGDNVQKKLNWFSSDLF
jgi:hypothetical protein